VNVSQFGSWSGGYIEATLTSEVLQLTLWAKLAPKEFAALAEASSGPDPDSQAAELMREVALGKVVIVKVF
jgi:hypothetical protein